MNQLRTPAGQPTGGQFAGASRPEAEATLAAPEAQMCAACWQPATQTIIYGQPADRWNHACDEHAEALRSDDVAVPSGKKIMMDPRDVQVRDELLHGGHVLPILSVSTVYRDGDEQYVFGTPIGPVTYLLVDDVPLNVPE